MVASSITLACTSGFERALALYQRRGAPYSIGWAHRRLARLESGAERDAHVAAARTAWLGISRPDLVADLATEFGSGDDPDRPGSH